MRADVPDLKTEPTSENYEISFITNPYRAHILFHPGKIFFIVETHGYFLKLDAQGHESFRVKTNEKGFYHIPFSPIIVTDRGLYDLSEPALKRHAFDKLVNAKKGVRLTQNSFEKRFNDAYKRADVVVFGQHSDHIGRVPAYMRIAGLWTVFYLDYGTSEINKDYNFGYKITNVPAKHEDMILLRDPSRKKFSHAYRDIRDGEVPLKEKNIRYVSDTKLKLETYKNTGVSDSIAYTNIPILKRGTAIYRLSVGKETITFKEIAVRTVFGRRIDTHLNLFIAPKSSQNDVSASFLEFVPGNNIDTNGSDGLYVIRPKR